jgi:hypothetical protein
MRSGIEDKAKRKMESGMDGWILSLSQSSSLVLVIFNSVVRIVFMITVLIFIISIVLMITILVFIIISIVLIVLAPR